MKTRTEHYIVGGVVGNVECHRTRIYILAVITSFCRYRYQI